MHTGVKQVARISFIFGLFGLFLLASSYTTTALNSVDDDQSGSESWTQGRTLLTLVPITKLAKIFSIVSGPSLRTLTVGFLGSLFLIRLLQIFFTRRRVANTRAPPRSFSYSSL